MTQDEAYNEARKRWGESASVGADLKHKKYYVFGETNENIEDSCKGIGKSWEEAFANADKEHGA